MVNVKNCFINYEEFLEKVIKKRHTYLLFYMGRKRAMKNSQAAK